MPTVKAPYGVVYLQSGVGNVDCTAGLTSVEAAVGHAKAVAERNGYNGFMVMHRATTQVQTWICRSGQWSMVYPETKDTPAPRVHTRSGTVEDTPIESTPGAAHSDSEPIEYAYSPGHLLDIPHTAKWGVSIPGTNTRPPMSFVLLPCTWKSAMSYAKSISDKRDAFNFTVALVTPQVVYSETWCKPGRIVGQPNAGEWMRLSSFGPLVRKETTHGLVDLGYTPPKASRKTPRKGKGKDA